jgi:PPM family protein phosphatase
MMRVAEHWHGSDLGRQRQGNEDNYFVRAPLFVVADGMGGAQAGEVASEMAAESFDRGLPEGRSVAEGLVGIIEDANRRIHDRARADADYAGMGTTVTAAHVGEDCVTIAHVGDSRAYVMRDGDLVRLTRDHSLVGELVARGKLTEEQAEMHPQRSVITRSVGPEPNVEVDVDVFPARDGDVFLVCSDGLTSMVQEGTVKAIVREARSLADAGRRLIDAANDAGGRDNITVVLFRLQELGGGAAATEDVSELDTSEADVVRDTGEDDGGAVRASAGDETEARYRSSATMAMPAVRPRAEPEAPPPEPPRTGRLEPLREEEEDAPPQAPGHHRPERRRRRVLPALIALAIVLVVVVGGFWTASQVVYFVGTDPQRANTVTIYQGLPYELPFGIKLYSRHAGSGVTLAEVPAARRATFTDHKLRSLDDAENLVNALEQGRIEP